MQFFCFHSIVVQQLESTGLRSALKERVSGLKKFATWRGVTWDLWTEPWPNKEHGKFCGGGVKELQGNQKEEDATSRLERFPLEMAFEKDLEERVAGWQPKVMRKALEVEAAAQRKAQHMFGDQREASSVGAQVVLPREIVDDKARKAGRHSGCRGPECHDDEGGAEPPRGTRGEPRMTGVGQWGDHTWAESLRWEVSKESAIQKQENSCSTEHGWAAEI